MKRREEHSTATELTLVISYVHSIWFWSDLECVKYLQVRLQWPAWLEMCQSPPSLQPSSPLNKELTFRVIYSWWISWGINQIHVFLFLFWSSFFQDESERKPSLGWNLRASSMCRHYSFNRHGSTPLTSSFQSDKESQNLRTTIKQLGLKGSLS